MKAPTDPRTKPLKKINSRKIEWVEENGDIHDRDLVTCWLDPRGTPRFVYLLPEYAELALDIKGGVIAGKTAEEAYDNWKAALRKYQEHVRTGRAEAVIIAAIGYYGRNEKGNLLPRPDRYSNRFDGHADEVKVSLRYTRAFRVGKSIFEAKAIEEASDQPWPNNRKVVGYKPGARIGYVDGVVLDWTPELEAQLKRVHEAINDAARVLCRVVCAEDVHASLMGLGKLMLPAPATVE